MTLQDSEDLSSNSTEPRAPESRPEAGNRGDQVGVASEDVSGLINSEGEEEQWKPVKVGTSSVFTLFTVRLQLTVIPIIN